MKITIKAKIIVSLDCLWALYYFFLFKEMWYDFLHFHFCNDLKKWKSRHFFFLYASNNFNLVIKLQQQSTCKIKLKSLWHKKHNFCYWPFFIVPNIPIINRESGIMTRALPTPTEKGIFFFHKSETYELICNYASCWWVTHPHQRTVVRNNWPVAMYISDAFTNTICENCGNNTYICLISIIKFWLLM